MNILLAEDDAVARLTLGAALKGMGHVVTEMEHGGEAWANLQLSHFPIVISDWQMPEVDGPELCRRIRARAGERDTYFLLVTVTGGKKRYLEGMEAGADDFITQPVDIDELRARLKAADRILGLRRHVHQLEGLLPICAYCKRITVATHAYTVAPGFVELEHGARAFWVSGLGDATAWDFNLKIGVRPGLQLEAFGAGYVRTAAGFGAGQAQWFTSVGLANGGIGAVGVATELFDFTGGGAGPRQRGFLAAVMVTVVDWVVVDAGGVRGWGDGTPDQLFVGVTTNVGRIFK